MTPIWIGETPALLLGPLIVRAGVSQPGHRREGARHALARSRARRLGARLVVLVGDESYYGRMGFARTPLGRVVLPGPVDPARVLHCELQPGAFEGVKGKVRGA